MPETVKYGICMQDTHHLNSNTRHPRKGIIHK